MLKQLAPAVLGLILLQSASAWAYDCSPHCDYVHDYGPYDFTYVRPGLFGYPVCDRRGDCAPHLVYQYGRTPWGDVTIRIRPTRPPR
jgi:hypothetical protein